MYYYFITQRVVADRKCVRQYTEGSTWAINVKWFIPGIEGKALHQAKQTEEMITMEMSYENIVYFHKGNLTLHHLFKCSFSAIKQIQDIVYLQTYSWQAAANRLK